MSCGNYVAKVYFYILSAETQLCVLVFLLYYMLLWQ